MRFVRLSLLMVLFALAACGTPTNTTSGDTTGQASTSNAASAASSSAAAQSQAAPSEATTSSQATDSTAESGAATDPVERNDMYQAVPTMSIDVNKQYTATIETTKGTMTAELYAKEAPITVNNFVFLARDNYFQNIRFHRIIEGFMVQTGDPTGTGRGGPGYRFEDEPIPDNLNYTRGTLAMANAGPNTNGSQFFIMHQDGPLPKNYTIFGKLTQGEDVLDAIANSPVQMNPESGEQSQPVEEIRIVNVTISEQ